MLVSTQESRACNAPSYPGLCNLNHCYQPQPLKYSTRLFWMRSKQVFPLCRKWFKLEPRLCPVCSAEITGPADALWACVLICADADSQYLLIPTLVSTGHRTDVGDYKEGFREAVGPSVCGSNLLWRRRRAPPEPSVRSSMEQASVGLRIRTQNKCFPVVL